MAEDNARCGSSMLRPSSNHGTLWLHNDDAWIPNIIYIWVMRYMYFAHNGGQKPLS